MRFEETLEAHNLTSDEYDAIVEKLGREPNENELGLFSVMWSEHCSYKSSRVHLKRLPTRGPRVLQGPGENAGVVDIGHGLAAVFKVESHNHPSFIEPFQGAATGVGGIIRDIFTMGARPVALMNSLRFGPLAVPKNRSLLSGCVAGIASYGNSMGIPTVGGEVVFEDCYNLNPLVNAFCLGLASKDRIFLAKAEGADRDDRPSAFYWHRRCCVRLRVRSPDLPFGEAEPFDLSAARVANTNHLTPRTCTRTCTPALEKQRGTERNPVPRISLRDRLKSESPWEFHPRAFRSGI